VITCLGGKCNMKGLGCLGGNCNMRSLTSVSITCEGGDCCWDPADGELDCLGGGCGLDAEGCSVTACGPADCQIPMSAAVGQTSLVWASMLMITALMFS